VAAAAERIDARLSTLDEETALITGGDFEANVRQMAKERRMLEKAGLIAPPAQNKPALPGESSDGDNGEQGSEQGDPR